MRDEHGRFQVGLTMEDDFTLTRLRNAAHSLEGKERDQYLWRVIFKFVCRERAFKAVMDEVGVAVDTNVDIFDDFDEEKD